MEASAKIKYLRYSERKLRQVADIVRGKSVEESFAILGIMKETKKGALLLEKALKSAVANFQQTDEGAGVSTDAMVIKSIQVDKGTIIKRIQPRAQGRAFRINKPLSHVSIVIAD